MLPTQIPSYFKSRRDQLMKAHPGAAFIIPSNRELIRNSDVTYPFRQDSHFYYLTGFQEPDAFLLLVPKKDQAGSYQTIFFVLSRDPEKEMWEGERYGVEGALGVFGADLAYPQTDFFQKLPELLQGVEEVYYRLGLRPELDHEILNALETHRKRFGRSGKALLPIKDASGPIGEMRLFKSKEEMALMRKSCEISCAAHVIAMKETRPGMNESEIEALVDYVFRKNGCQRLGYGSIIAGGKNATCLHYRFNHEELRDGDLLLIDAGGEYNYFSADITRTFPIGNQFSPPQARLYDWVLKAQEEGIKMVKPGVKLPDIHRKVTDVLVEGMLELGLLKGKRNELIQSNEHRRFYPHNTSHWLGMDVHDAGLYVIQGFPTRILNSIGRYEL